MEYELRDWNDATKMPNIEPQKAGGRLGAIKDAIKAAKDAAAGNVEDDYGNPDILIDNKTRSLEMSITSAKISFFLSGKAKGSELSKFLGMLKNEYKDKDEFHEALFKKIKKTFPDLEMKYDSDGKKVRRLRMEIEGNLYLPLERSGMDKAAKSIIGDKSDENEKRDTLLLWQWAILTKKDAEYYRGVALSILTKAGDYRIIIANNMCVDSYAEHFDKDTMYGTFELTLVQRPDETSSVSVKGLGYEKVFWLKSLAKGFDKLEGKLNKVAGNETVQAITDVSAKAAKEYKDIVAYERLYEEYEKAKKAQEEANKNANNNSTDAALDNPLDTDKKKE